MEPETKKSILAILRIENSKWFHLCEHISLRLDYFFRFFYLIGFLWFLAFSVAILYENLLLFYVLLGVCLLLLATYTALKLRYRMRASRLTLCRAICFYLKCRCCIKN